ncbi:uncharacterized protein [Nicotiana tomentosiformis]|uniref:uncharacterized protein n=1 Tax=Nicotiana tomentosiformis TaxID=4098 RepID=UPI00388CB809
MGTQGKHPRLEESIKGTQGKHLRLKESIKDKEINPRLIEAEKKYRRSCKMINQVAITRRTKNQGKVRIEIYAKSYDVKVWRVIKKGNYPLLAAAQPPVDPEDIDEYTDEQMAVVQVNAKARNLLYNAISGEEYEKISSCDKAKEIWDKLEVTYEGTSKVKETHINMLVHDYEIFQMKEGESIEEMLARFSKIINDLKVFGKPFSSGDQVRKILRTFKKTHLKKTNQEEKKKIVAFKATTERTDNDIDDDPEALQEEIIMVSRNMDGLMRRYRNTKRGRIPPRRTRQYNEQYKNDGKCYKCGRFGHVQAEYPELKRKVSRGFNKNKLFGSWSDEDSSEHGEIANLCFMTILENDMNKLSRCWTDKDILDDDCKDDNENCFMARGETSEVRPFNCERCNELQDILDLTLEESQKMVNEIKRLNREIKDWKLNLEVCEIKKEVLQDEVDELQMQLNGMHKSTSHSSIKSNHATYKSTGKGPARTESTSTDTNGRTKNGSCSTCHYCNKNGHKYSFYRFRKSNEHHRSSRNGKWYLDSACSSHMTGDKNLFKEVIKIDGGTVKFGDDSKGKIVGTRTVPLNNNCDITEVYLVDGLNYNLLSISQLCDSGYEVKFKKTGCAI